MTGNVVVEGRAEVKLKGANVYKHTPNTPKRLNPIGALGWVYNCSFGKGGLPQATGDPPPAGDKGKRMYLDYVTPQASFRGYTH